MYIFITGIYSSFRSPKDQGFVSIPDSLKRLHDLSPGIIPDRWVGNCSSFKGRTIMSTFTPILFIENSFVLPPPPSQVSAHFNGLYYGGVSKTQEKSQAHCWPGWRFNSWLLLTAQVYTDIISVARLIVDMLRGTEVSRAFPQLPLPPVLPPPGMPSSTFNLLRSNWTVVTS